MNHKKKTAYHLISNYRWRSIFFHYWKFTLGLFLIPMLLLGGFWVMYHVRQVSSAIKSSMEETYAKTEQTLETIFSETAKQYENFYMSDSVQAFLTTPADRLSGLTITNNTAKIQALMYNYLSVMQYIDSIYIYSFENQYVLASNNGNYIQDFPDQSFYRHYSETNSGTFIMESETSGGEKAICMVFELYSASMPSGLLVINLDTREIENQIFSDGQRYDMTLHLYDKNAVCIYTSNPNAPSPMEPSGQNGGYIFQSDLASTPLSAYACFSMEAYRKSLRSLALIVLGALLLLFVLSLALSFISSMHFYSSIASTVSLLEIPYPDRQGQSNKGDTFNELNYLNNNILQMISQNSNIEKELIQKIQHLRKAQSVALQTQINPHFLFNTLNLINAIIIKITKSDNDATKIVSTLSDILHMSLDTNQYIVTVDEELEIAKKYTEIELIKTNNSFDITWSADSSCLKDKTVKLILQPVLENAINHGVKKLRKTKGLIQVSVKKDAHCIRFRVTDNGPGMPKEVLDDLRMDLAEDEIPESRHIGLRNVNQRIKLLYGEEYGVEVFSTAEETTVILTIPAEN